MLDFLITGARVCTGMPEKANVHDVGIEGDRIVVLPPGSEAPEAHKVIDGNGLLLAPGFIDPHASTGFGYFFPHAADHKLHQGITTEIIGNCGTSPGPIGPHLTGTMERLADQIGFPFDWRSLEEYFSRIRGDLQFNIATLVGHSTLRGGFMEDWKTFSEAALDDMKASLAEAMDEGALGFSTGLIYAPGCYADTREVVELAKIAAEKGGVYASHIRNERNKVEEAVAEALSIGAQAGINPLISHLKAAEQQNWGKIPGILDQIEAFNDAHPHLHAAVDVYPYTAVSTKLRAFVPTELLQDGIDRLPQKLTDTGVRAEVENWIRHRNYDLSQMLIISDEIEEYAAKTVSRIAAERGIPEADALMEVLSRNTESWIVYHCIDQGDIDTVVSWKHSMICTDSWSHPINGPKTIGQPHPRSYGAFTTYLERYVRTLGTLSWEEAIHKITYLPASFFHLKERGQVKSGYFADLVLFNPETLKANATYTHPKRLSSGVDFVWVNGKLVLEEGEVRDTVPGRILTLNP